MSKLKTTKVYLFDAIPLAEQLEKALEGYLVDPPIGIYKACDLKPVMLPNEFYYQLQKQASESFYSMVPIAKLEDIKGDVFDVDGNKVISEREVKYLSLSSVLPVTGINLIYTIFDRIITNNSAWTKKKDHGIEEALEGFFHLEHRYNQALYDRIVDITVDARCSLINFINDEKWIMHFVRHMETDPGTLMIEKTGDYRVFDWERRMNSGEWM